MPIRSIFVAYPYRLGQGYRDALSARFEGSGIELRYADDNLTNLHVMEKIRRMMGDADVCFFDVTESNPNVMFELGYALGAEEPGFVVIDSKAVDKLSADITGWDQLRYTDFTDLAEKVYDHVMKGRVPLRPDPTTIALPRTHDVPALLRQLRFGIPTGESARLCVYAVPVVYDRHYKARDILGTPPFRAQDLPESVLAGPNKTKYGTLFWVSGFDYPPRPGPDFIEVYQGPRDGTQRDRTTNFRIYLSGAAFYMQRLRTARGKPFLYLNMFEEVIEMALISIADARSRLDFGKQGDLAVGAVFLNADDLHVSYATRDFYPADDVGRSLAEPVSEIWVPHTPLQVASNDLSDRAHALAEEMTADLRVRVE